MRIYLPLLLIGLAAPLVRSAPGDARVARWKDDRTAAFLLMFDDGWPSLWQVAAPALAQRGLTGTFYINPAKGEYLKFAGEWEEKVWRLGMAYGNHTMTHKGVRSLEEGEREIGDCAAYIRRIVPHTATQLVSYAQPGVDARDWTLTAAELDTLLNKHRLVSRPDFRDHGAVYHLKTAAEILALADRAIATQGMEYVIFHGIERIQPDWGYQDFWAFKQSEFLALLDALKARADRGQLWIADHIAQHRYAVARAAAAVRTVQTTPQAVELDLVCAADPRDYALPLTLVAEVPPDWARVRIRSSGGERVVQPVAGRVTFDAPPGAIRLEPARP